jgi:hypothetical protein
MKWRCNSCLQQYSDRTADGQPLYHVCYPEIVEHAEFDGEGKEIKPEKRTPRMDVRNEHPDPRLRLADGKWVTRVPHPEEPGQFLEQEAGYAIISEGLGRTEIP